MDEPVKSCNVQSAKRILDIQIKSVNDRHLYIVGNEIHRDKTSKKTANNTFVSKIGNDMTSPSEPSKGYKPPSSHIPPCKVCDDEATGLHYGVYTCDACKAFFMRTSRRSTADIRCKCKTNETKTVSDVTRKRSYTKCTKCRYEKCVRLGMSKEAIKIGRYTVDRRRQNDREIDTLKKQQVLEKDVLIATVDSSSHTNKGDHKCVSSETKIEQKSSQKVSHFIELLQDTASPHTDTQVSRKRKSETQAGQPENGLLFKSLTNSIFQSLYENQLTNVTSGLNNLHSSDISPMEQLYMQPFVAKKQSSQTMTTRLIGENVSITIGDEKSQVTNSDSYTVKQIQPEYNVNNEDGQCFTITNHQEHTTTITEDLADQLENALTKSDCIANDITFCFDSTVGSLSSIEATSETPVSLSTDASGFSISTTNNETASPQDVLNPNANIDNDRNDIMFTATKINIDNHVTSCVNNEDELEELIENYDENMFEECDDILRDTVDTAQDSGKRGKHQGSESELMIEEALTYITNEDMDEIVRKLTAETLSDNGVVQITVADVKRRHAEYLNDYTLKMATFGSMDNISREEYLAFYQQTGIDIDNRQAMVLEALKHTEMALARMISFSKVIPGFENLLIEDQVNLIKSTRFQYEMVHLIPQGVCHLSHDLQVISCPWGQIYHMDEITNFITKDVIEEYVMHHESFACLHLSFEEASALKALIMTCPDLCELKQHDKVVAIHNKMEACVKRLLDNRIEQRQVTFSDVMRAVNGLHGCAALDRQVLEDMFDIWPVALNYQSTKEFMLQ